MKGDPENSSDEGKKAEATKVFSNSSRVLWSEMRRWMMMQLDDEGDNDGFNKVTQKTKTKQDRV